MRLYRMLRRPVRAWPESVGFGAGELEGLFLLIIGEDAVVDFGESTLMSGLDFLHGKNHEALSDLERRAEFAGTELEQGLMQIGRIAEVADGFGDGDGRSFADLEIEFLGEIVEGLAIRLADGGSHLIRDVVGVLTDFFIENDGDDRVANLFEGFGVGRLAVEHFDDVEAVLRLDEVGDRALGQAEGGLLKFGDGLAFDDPAEIAALGLGGIVLGIFLGEILEIGAVLGLLQDVLGLLANFGDFGVGLADGLEENVLDVDAIFDFVLINVGVVIGAQRRRRRPACAREAYRDRAARSARSVFSGT